MFTKQNEFEFGIIPKLVGTFYPTATKKVIKNKKTTANYFLISNLLFSNDKHFFWFITTFNKIVTIDTTKIRYQEI